MRYIWTILFSTLAVLSVFVIIDKGDIVTGPEVFLPGYKPGISLNEIPDPDVQALVRSNELFGDHLTVMIILSSEGDFLSGEDREKLADLTENLSKLDQIKYVLSVLDLSVMSGFSDEESEDIQRDFITDDHRKTLVMCSLNPKYKPIEALEDVERVLQRYDEYDPMVFGEPVIDKSLFEELKRQNFLYPPLIFLSILIVFLFQTRSLIGSLLSIAVPILAALIVFAVNFLLGNPLNTMTAMVISYLMIIGSAYGLHFYNAVQEYSSVSEAARRKFSPIFFSMLTTVAGFISFVFLKIRAFREFGFMVSAGLALVTFMIFSVMRELVKPSPLKPRKMGVSYPGDRIAKIVLIAVAILSLLSPLAIKRIKIGGTGIEYFRKNSEVIRAFESLKENFDVRETLYVILEKRRGAFTAGDNATVKDLALSIQKIDGVASVVFPFDVPIPLARIMKTRYPFLGMFVSQNAIRLMVNITDEGVSEVENLRKRIEDVLSEFPEYRTMLAGSVLVWNKVNQEVLSSQIQSMITSFLMIFLMISLAFRSFKTAVFGILPIAFTVLMNFVNMGILGIKLEISTSIIASMLMGLTIDYSIHMISDVKITRDPELSTERVGPSILANALGLDAGFAVLIFSILKLFVDVSVLTILGISLGAFLTLVIVPYFAKRL